MTSCSFGPGIAEQRHEDGRAKSGGFDDARLVPIVVPLKSAGVVLARHLCPAFFLRSGYLLYP